MKEELIKKVAWVGDEIVAQPIKGVVLKFSGLGASDLKWQADDDDMAWAANGGLVVVPYHNPWAWMNQDTVDFVDELIEAIRQSYRLEERLPIIATGGSMGGYGALAYTMFSRHKMARCAANCPVCDLPYHYDERADLPRTMHSAFSSYADITDQLIARSPVHQAQKLPGINYLIVHGTQDDAVAKAHHSDVLVAKMRAGGLNIEYLEPEMGHCGPMPADIYQKWIDFVLEGLSE